MSYTHDSIQRAIDSADLLAIIGGDTVLKKAGAQYKGCSPLTGEKTPSFYVSPDKGVWYCYSSGQGGGIVRYLELKHGMNFIDAVKHLAGLGNVMLEEEQEDAEDRRYREDRVEMERVLLAAYRQWQQQLKADWDADGPVSKYLKQRGYTGEECAMWGIGYAPKKREFIARQALDKGMWKYAEMAGLCAHKDEKYYDVMQDRITFEIRDKLGKAIAFAGRQAPGNEFGGKYVNTKQTPLFDKSRVVYGMAKARTEIAKTGVALIMEGPTDVHACHRHGHTNAVACQGTALTSQHAVQLAYIARKAVIVSDGDDAGQRMMEKAIPVLLAAGLEVAVVCLPAKKDPAELLTEDAAAFAERLTNAADAIMHMAGQWLTAAVSPAEKGQAVQYIVALLGNVPEKTVAAAYINQLSQQYKREGLTKTSLSKLYADHSDALKVERTYDEIQTKLPDGVDKDFVALHGFYPLVDRYNTGYYFMSEGGSGHGRKASNFVVEPIFHRRAPNDLADDARVIKINNGIHPAKLVMMPSDALVSVEMFRKWCFRQGSYMWTGGTSELQRLVSSILFLLPEAHEITTLGYQPEGFFAYQNAIYNGKLEHYNSYGLVKHGDMHFFSPGVSDIFKGVRAEDNKYKYDAFLKYIPSSLTLPVWAAKMKDVYGSYAMAAIAFTFLSAFRDLVFSVDKNCPFLYIYGPSQSGKSKIAESVQAVFFYKRQMFQINSGTEFAFMAYLGRFRNTPGFFNEFDDKYLRGPKDSWFQIIKGSYDGEGRMRGSGDKRNVEIQEINSTIGLVGQYLSTRDDNSVLSRSVVLAYEKRDFSEQEVRTYSELKELEDQGITNISAEIVKHRPAVEKAYRTGFYAEMKALSQLIHGKGERYNERVLRNYSSLSTMWSLFAQLVNLPWSHKEYQEWSAEQIVLWSQTISTNDVLQEFWNAIEGLAIQKLIRMDVHYKVKANQSTFKDADGNDVVVDDGPADLLYLRPKIVHPEYLKFMKGQGLEGLNQTTLLSYMEQRPYYLGRVKNERFDANESGGTIQTSAYVLNFDILRGTTDISMGMKMESSEMLVAGVESKDDLPF